MELERRRTRAEVDANIRLWMILILTLLAVLGAGRAVQTYCLDALPVAQQPSFLEPYDYDAP